MTEKEKQFADSILGIHALCEMIVIYYHVAINGTRFKNPRIESKADKIKEFANSIRNKELQSLIRLQNGEDFEDDHVLQLWRIFNHFLLTPTDSLREFADGIEKMEEK